MSEPISLEERLSWLDQEGERRSLEEIYRLGRDARQQGNHKDAHRCLVQEVKESGKYLPLNRKTESHDFLYFEKSLLANIETAIAVGDFSDVETYIEYGNEVAKLFFDDEGIKKEKSYFERIRQLAFDSGRFDEFNHFNNRIVEHRYEDSPEYYDYMAFRDQYNQKLFEMGDYGAAYKAVAQFREDLIHDIVNEIVYYSDGQNKSTRKDFMKSSEKIIENCIEIAIEQNDYKLATAYLADRDLQNDDYLAIAEKMLTLATDKNDLEYMFRLSGLKMYFTDWDCEHIYTEKQVQEHIQSKGISIQPV